MEEKSSADYRWIHILLKGERPVTESTQQEHREIDKYLSTFGTNSLEAVTVPILEFNFKNLDRLAQAFEKAIESLRSGLEDVGIVLTSPRVVEAISRSLGSRFDTLKEMDSELIFVVGEKTGADCTSKLGLGWNKSSSLSGNSASLSEVIKITSSSRQRPVRLIYAKSSLADQKIEDALSNEKNIVIDSVIVYETKGVTDVAKHVKNDLDKYMGNSKVVGRKKLVLNFIFFSPSGVECFFSMNQEEIATYLDRCASAEVVVIKYSCIGRTTESCLRRYGARVHCLAEKPNAQSLVDVILLKCPARDGSLGG